MIEAKDVSCTFARNPFSKEGFMAVSPVSIQFIDGERYAIVGESGSGKTTLARMIAGLQRPTTGNIYVDGMPVYGKHKVHTNYFKEVQIIQQDSSSALDPKMSVGRSIEEPLLCFFHLDKGERKKRCHDLMDYVICLLNTTRVFPQNYLGASKNESLLQGPWQQNLSV